MYTEEENKSLKTELSELRARHKLELEKVRKDKEKEMEQVHERLYLWWLNAVTASAAFRELHFLGYSLISIACLNQTTLYVPKVVCPTLSLHKVKKFFGARIYIFCKY